MPKSASKDDLIASFTAKHGARYDYSFVAYVNATTKVEVRRHVHGPFLIAPGHHKRGVGCRHCSFDRARVDRADFVARAREHHGNRYDYSLFGCLAGASSIAVRILCREHQEVFEQLPSAHMRGHTGCGQCLSSMLSGPAENRGKRKPQAEIRRAFVEKATLRHGARYNYGQFEYRGAAVKGAIVCAEHGLYWQTPSNHLRGTQCPECAKALKHQHSLKSQCMANGVDYWRALKRRQAGMPIERTLAKHLLRSDRTVNPITVYGRPYPNLESAVRELGPPASSATIARWLDSGVSPEDAFERVPNPGYADGIIYVVEQKDSGRRYVRLTVQTLERRWVYHVEQARARRITGAESLHATIREHGADKFSTRQIDKGISKRDLERKERDWIARLGTLFPKGFNLNKGGVSGGSNRKPVTVDGTFFPSTAKAVEHIAQTRSISLAAAKKRLEMGRIDVKAIAKRGESKVKTPAYKAWSHIVHGVLQPTSKDHIPGLELCDRWRDPNAFIADVGQPPRPGMAFVRLDKRTGYSLANCRWVTRSEASRMSASKISIDRASKCPVSLSEVP